MILLGLNAALDSLAVFSNLSQVGLLQRLLRHEALATGAAATNDARQQIVAVLQIGLYVITAVVFLLWINRAYSNLGALSSRKSRFTPGWAVGAWFVPFLNLIRPYNIVTETWWVSMFPSEADRSVPGFVPASPALVKLWWGMFLVSGIMGRAIGQSMAGAKTLPELLNASYLLVAGDAVGILTALLAIQVVRTISIGQDAAASASRVFV